MQTRSAEPSDTHEPMPAVCNRCALPGDLSKCFGGTGELCALCMGEFATWWALGMRAVRPDAPRVGMRVRAEAPPSGVMTVEELAAASSRLVSALKGSLQT